MTAEKQPKSPDTVEASRGEAERRMLEAATRLVATEGIDGLTLADVGEAAGYSRGLPAHYFGRKEDLIGALAGYITESFAGNLRRVLPKRRGLHGLLMSIDVYFDYAATNLEQTRAIQFVLTEALREPVLAAAAAAVTKQAVDRIEADIREGIRRKEIRKDVDPRAQAQLILAELRTTILHWLIDPEELDLTALRDAFAGNLRRTLAA